MSEQVLNSEILDDSIALREEDIINILNNQYTEQEILESLLSKVDSGLDKREGSIIYDALSPLAFEIWRQRAFFIQVLYQSFVTKAEGIFLDYNAEDNGYHRYQAVPSVVSLLFVGEVGSVIPVGTEVGSLKHDYVFATNDVATIGPDGTVAVLANCKQTGIDTNIEKNTLNVLVNGDSSSLGVRSVNNPENAFGGENEEDDESLRERILYKKQNPSYGGNINDLTAWALEVTGVSYARAIDKPRGIGTVDIIIGGPVSIINNLIKEVQAHLDNLKPSGLDLIVKEVTIIDFNITLEVEGITREEAIKTIENYFDELGVGQSYYKSKLIYKLISVGATDVNISYPLESKVDIDASSSPKAIIDITVV